MNQKRQAGSGTTGLAPWVNVWDAEHLKRAHALNESGKARGKGVLEGF
ncbi:hypothetical protein RDI61_03135 [Pseudomonas plecoglossicida]|nr:MULTISPECIES: hypothetical protein [Pseudomonas]MDN5518241.1 hypothetical protein [Pseudomonas sp.]MDQ7963043.1 hypothetical protein [Pseudomonas plecoglossicida]WBM49632.1 hypothetical protein M2J85_12380 [Pseudomonas putida]WFG05972.1 hypothetical protein P3X84_13475 [Pseudomonas putida]